MAPYICDHDRRKWPVPANKDCRPAGLRTKDYKHRYGVPSITCNPKAPGTQEQRRARWKRLRRMWVGQGTPMLLWSIPPSIESDPRLEEEWWEEGEGDGWDTEDDEAWEEEEVEEVEGQDGQNGTDPHKWSWQPRLKPKPTTPDYSADMIRDRRIAEYDAAWKEYLDCCEAGPPRFGNGMRCWKRTRPDPRSERQRRAALAYGIKHHMREAEQRELRLRHEAERARTPVAPTAVPLPPKAFRWAYRDLTWEENDEIEREILWVEEQKARGLSGKEPASKLWLWQGPGPDGHVVDASGDVVMCDCGSPPGWPGVAHVCHDHLGREMAGFLERMTWVRHFGDRLQDRGPSHNIAEMVRTHFNGSKEVRDATRKRVSHDFDFAGGRRTDTEEFIAGHPGTPLKDELQEFLHMRKMVQLIFFRRVPPGVEAETWVEPEP